MRSKVSRNFEDILRRCKILFPAAYNFLAKIIQSPEGFWLSSATNAHLYFKDSFLAFVKVESDAIVFSPQYNGRIEEGTVDRHKLIFPDVFKKLTKDSDGVSAPWASIGADGCVTVKRKVPDEFFDRLLEEIKRAHGVNPNVEHDSPPEVVLTEDSANSALSSVAVLPSPEEDVVLLEGQSCDTAFVKALAGAIEEYRHIPKLQVERLVGPILGIFLEKLLEQMLCDDPELSGTYTILSPEWPLRKDDGSCQSTNIDWLLLNKDKKQLLLVELKTAVSSFDQGQLSVYRDVMDNISRFGAGFLMKDLLRIGEASQEQRKYKAVIKRLEQALDGADLTVCRKVELVYIAPAATIRRAKEAGVTHGFAFSDLPAGVGGELDGAWRVLRKALIALDDQQERVVVRSSNGDDGKGQWKDIVEAVTRQFPGNRPTAIAFGATGEGSRPNFQVSFADGSVQPFYGNGTVYTRVSKFKEANLGRAIPWEEFVRGCKD